MFECEQDFLEISINSINVMTRNTINAERTVLGLRFFTLCFRTKELRWTVNFYKNAFSFGLFL